ncbi:MAG: arabinofuranosidase catalytic domain-containing protein, partial [Gemmatimonadota bacterium]
MTTRIPEVSLFALALGLAAASCGVTDTAPPRPEGPCDIYAEAGAPCAGAHSTTRALYASYDGPLYQVMRQSDGETLDIGVVPPTDSPVPDAGGYADAAAQDAFCADTYCWITTLYDQSGMDNHLVQAPRGGFSGPALGGFNTLPMADMAPVTVMGHKVYGIFIVPGMGLRWNDARGTAVDDQAQGQYWVVNGHHYNSGCCFNYGNAETDSRDDGDGTMETTHFGNSTGWYLGQDPGPWVMTDQENNLVGCVNESPDDKYCPDLPVITWRFVTATADGEPGHWRSMGGDAQGGALQVMYDGGRIQNDRSSYDPMRKQGAILLGNGGDNSNASQGTFYEGAMTAAGYFPTRETNQRIQDNVVAAGYDVPRLRVAPASAVDAPPGLQTFAPGASQQTTVTFSNTTGTTATEVELSVWVPEGWRSIVAGSSEASRTFASVAPGESVSATFEITSGAGPFNGDLVGTASWTSAESGQSRSETAVEKVRNVSPIKINEFRITASAPGNSTDGFIELYNAGDAAVDLSGWTLTEHATRLPIFSSIEIPDGTTLAAGGFYLLGLATSGLAVPALAGDATIHVRSVEGLSAGDVIEIGTGAGVETRRITRVGTAAGLVPAPSQSPFRRRVAPGSPTTLWQPIPEGPVITVPEGATNVPVTSVDGFEAGQKMALGHGATYP